MPPGAGGGIALAHRLRLGIKTAPQQPNDAGRVVAKYADV
jgi:hypothetical protein